MSKVLIVLGIVILIAGGAYIYVQNTNVESDPSATPATGQIYSQGGEVISINGDQIKLEVSLLDNSKREKTIIVSNSTKIWRLLKEGEGFTKAPASLANLKEGLSISVTSSNPVVEVDRISAVEIFIFPAK
jgi:hypothetical protein